MSGSSSDQDEKKELPDKKEEIDEIKLSSETDEKVDASSPKNKEEEEEDSDAKDDESDESEGGVGLLDRPVEVSGSRERKKVQRLEVSFGTPKEKQEISEGAGEKLGECPIIEYQIQKNLVSDLKVLHKILFSRPGSGTEIKKNIRKFSGFTFKKDSSDFEKKKASMEKIKQADLKHVCEILDLERGGTKDDVISRILSFLFEPKPSGRKVPEKKKGKGAKRKREGKKEKVSKNSSNKKTKSLSSDEQMSDDSSDAEQNNKDDGDSDDDSEKEQPKKKKQKTPAKKKEVVVKKKDEKAKKVEKKNASKPLKKKPGSSDDDDASSDDEPLVKGTKSPPSDDDIKALVKKILDTSDLQKITMKTVIKQVFDAFPDYDLSDKKDYIKATVKSVIS